jgi:hypothetical protein
MKKILFESKRLAKLAGINEATSSKPWAWERPIENSEASETDEKSAILSIAKALAARAEKLAGVDIESPNYSEERINPNEFLSPYADIEGDGREVRPLAEEVYENYVSNKAGDQADSLEGIIERIGIDYFDEHIEYVLKARGDDRFTTPVTVNNDSEDNDTADEDPWAEARANHKWQELAKWRPGDR